MPDSTVTIVGNVTRDPESGKLKAIEDAPQNAVEGAEDQPESGAHEADADT